MQYHSMHLMRAQPGATVRRGLAAAITSWLEDQSGTQLFTLAGVLLVLQTVLLSRTVRC